MGHHHCTRTESTRCEQHSLYVLCFLSVWSTMFSWSLSAGKAAGFRNGPFWVSNPSNSHFFSTFFFHIFLNTRHGDKYHPTAGMPLPSIYTTAFDLAQPVGGKITVLAINKILSVSGLPPATVDKVCQEKFRGRLDWVQPITNPIQQRNERSP